MPLKIVRTDALPRPTRRKVRSLELTEEWTQLQAKLADGLKPYEAVYISFTEAQKAKLGIKNTGRIFLKMTKEFLRKASLQYDAWRYHTEGQEVVVVAARGVPKKKREKTQ